MFTATDGRYPEFFPNDTIVRIGSVLYNTLTNQVVAFVKTDTVYSEADGQPQPVSRFFSADPLADKFPYQSPYDCALNNPIFRKAWIRCFSGILF